MYRSPFAGTWYPDDPEELRELVAGCFAKSEARTGSLPLPEGVAYIVPHAGIAYSGAVAAAVYRQLQAARPRRVVLLGFLHSRDHAGILLPDCDVYRTPLGDVRVDRAAMEELARQPFVETAPVSAACDHSVEIQLPLLQWALPEAEIVPVYVGRLYGPTDWSALFDGRAAVAVSSDFTHYGRQFGFEPFPADGRIAQRLRALDERMIEAAGSLDPALFRDELRASGCTLCGYRPIEALLAALQGRDLYRETLDYDTSGAITNDYRVSVSYAALGYFLPQAFAVGEAERGVLLRLARRALESVEQGRRCALPCRDVPAALQRRAGVFVSLHHRGRILGCVGTRPGRWPLWRAAGELAQAAAVQDPRARGVVWNAADVEIEISILTPLRRVTDRMAFTPGEHGLSLECGDCDGLLLPQVGLRSPYHHRRRFLDALAMKAGGGPALLDDPAARLYAFRAQVFSDAA